MAMGGESSPRKFEACDAWTARNTAAASDLGTYWYIFSALDNENAFSHSRDGFLALDPVAQCPIVHTVD